MAPRPGPGPAEWFGIPELKNPRYLGCFRAGRRSRIHHELSGDAGPVPLYSHHATYQSLYHKGWHSVTELDLVRARQRRGQEVRYV